MTQNQFSTFNMIVFPFIMCLASGLGVLLCFVEMSLITTTFLSIYSLFMLLTTWSGVQTKILINRRNNDKSNNRRL